MTHSQNCTDCRCGQANGECHKADAHNLLEARRHVYIRRGRRALLQAMLAGNGRATADDVYAAVELPGELDGRCLGTVPGRLAYDQIISPASFTRSKRPERHAGWLQVWELTDRAAAERWLQDHPELPSPDENATDCDDYSQRPLFPLNPNAAGGPVPAARCLSPDHPSQEVIECQNPV